MNTELYNQIKDMAEQINNKDAELGFYAMRKINAISPKSSLKSIIQTGEDIKYLAKIIYDGE